MLTEGCLERQDGRFPRFLVKLGLALRQRLGLDWFGHWKQTRTTRCCTGLHNGAALQWEGVHWCCAFVAIPWLTLILTRVAIEWPAVFGPHTAHSRDARLP